MLNSLYRKLIPCFFYVFLVFLPGCDEGEAVKERVEKYSKQLAVRGNISNFIDILNTDRVSYKMLSKEETIILNGVDFKYNFKEDEGRTCDASKVLFVRFYINDKSMSGDYYMLKVCIDDKDCILDWKIVYVGY